MVRIAYITIKTVTLFIIVCLFHVIILKFDYSSSSSTSILHEPTYLLCCKTYTYKDVNCISSVTKVENCIWENRIKKNLEFLSPFYQVRFTRCNWFLVFSPICHNSSLKFHEIVLLIYNMYKFHLTCSRTLYFPSDILFHWCKRSNI